MLIKEAKASFIMLKIVIKLLKISSRMNYKVTF